MILPTDINTRYADHCYRKMSEAHLTKRWGDAEFYARAISTEFRRIAGEYGELYEQEKSALPLDGKLP